LIRFPLSAAVTFLSTAYFKASGVVWRTSLKYPGTIRPPDHGCKGASCGWAARGCWIGQDPPRRSNELANQAHYCDGITPYQVPNTQGMRDIILVCLLQRREKVPRACLRCGWALFDRNRHHPRPHYRRPIVFGDSLEVEGQKPPA
jgi:hypothetical protein